MLSDFLFKILIIFKLHSDRAIGVCCPDDISEKTSQLTMPLPAAGNDEYVPPWEIQEENEQEDGTRQDTSDDRGCGVATKQYPKITGG